MTQSIILILGGFILLVSGGESLLRGAVKIARYYRLSEILVSAVIIGFGTSLPEMTVSINAALHDATNLALANVIGSNIANILLITAIAAILCPISVKKVKINDDLLFMLFATLVLFGLAIFGKINFVIGLIMLLGTVFYIIKSYYDENGEAKPKKIKCSPKQLAFSFALCILGLLGLGFGSNFLVEGAIDLATKLGVSQVIIGLSVVAIGSSLPELALAVVASFRRNSNVVIGNIIGSNIFNIMAILGVTGMVKVIDIKLDLVIIDLIIMSLVTLLLAALLYFRQGINRIIAAPMLLAYISYITFIALR